MEISTDEIRSFTECLCDHLEQTGRSTVNLKGDYYWVINPDQLQLLENEPNDFSIGQLSDDLSELRKISAEDAPAIGHGFVWLGHLLTILGNQQTA